MVVDPPMVCSHPPKSQNSVVLDYFSSLQMPQLFYYEDIYMVYNYEHFIEHNIAEKNNLIRSDAESQYDCQDEFLYLSFVFVEQLRIRCISSKSNSQQTMNQDIRVSATTTNIIYDQWLL